MKILILHSKKNQYIEFVFQRGGNEKLGFQKIYPEFSYFRIPIVNNSSKSNVGK